MSANRHDCCDGGGGGGGRNRIEYVQYIQTTSRAIGIDRRLESEANLYGMSIPVSLVLRRLDYHLSMHLLSRS
jgi:hypothetical protein